MKLETVKTIILIILVGISLLLTFGLWNYQPHRDLLHLPNTKYVSEVDLGGIEETKRSIIKPSSIIFHHDEKNYGFIDPKDNQSLYQDMQEWVLTDFQSSNSTGKLVNSNQVEIIFPNPMPMEIVKSLFTLKEDDPLPSWSFQRIFITFNQSYSSLNVYFLSIDGREQVKYIINNASVYAQLWSYITSQNGLTEYKPFGLAHAPIYLPVHKVEMRSRSLAIESIPPTKLLNALFTNPSIVSSNIGEAYFTDGQRGMHVLHNGLSIEFINPIHSNKKHKDPIELIEKSMLKVNEHKGWTDEYRLESIDLMDNLIRYRMHYEGYPVYNRMGLTEIEQQWRNQELFQYRRPLFNLNNLLGGDTVKLKSGEEVIDYLLNEPNYDLSNIRDVQIGYKLTYLEGASYSVILDPAWYINYKGDWQEIRFKDLEEIEKGGD